LGIRFVAFLAEMAGSVPILLGQVSHEHATDFTKPKAGLKIRI
jgi:hypothetical protein